MSRSVWAAAAAAALGLVAGAAGVFGAGGKGWPMRQEGGLLVVDTPHYQIRTDHAPEVAQLVASHQEALFAELYRRMGALKPVSQIPRLRVLLFRTKERYMKEVGSAGTGSQGMFSREQISGWAAPDDLDRMYEVLRHEGTHQFVSEFVGPRCPVWLNEGLAEFFRLGQFRGGRLEVGQAPSSEVNSLKKGLADGKLLALSRILSMTDQEWLDSVKAGGEKATFQYLQAWSLVHFLQGADGGKYRVPFTQMLYHLSRGKTATEAWQAAFGAPSGALEKRWRDYISDLKPTSGMECRDNLLILVNLLWANRDRPELATDLAAFYRAATSGQLSRTITYTLGTGVEISTQDPETVKMVFRCPEDRTKDATCSYEFGPLDAELGLPVIRCRHHAGYILETTYEKEATTGKLTMNVVSRPARGETTQRPGQQEKQPASDKPPPNPVASEGARP